MIYILQVPEYAPVGVTKFFQNVIRDLLKLCSQEFSLLDEFFHVNCQILWMLKYLQESQENLCRLWTFHVTGCELNVLAANQSN